MGEVAKSYISRFSNRAENYVKYRPGYPAGVFDFLRQMGINTEMQVADIGSGTGLFAEPLLRQGIPVYCIEPNTEMRAAGDTRLSKFNEYESLAGSGESTGLPGESVDLITVAQTFQWLDAEASLTEFRRILRPGGRVVMAWNIRRIDSPFLERFAALKSKFRVSGVRHLNEEKVRAFFSPNPVNQERFRNDQQLDFESLKGQLLSSSYAPLPGDEQYEDMISELISLFVKYNEGGLVSMNFDTVLFYGHV